MCVCVFEYACDQKKRERGRELHSGVLEFQLTLANVGGPDQSLSWDRCGPGVAEPCDRKTVLFVLEGVC